MTAMRSVNQNEASEIAARLGARIKLARQHRRIRQADLASSSGLSRSTIQSIERGDVSCSIGAALQVLWVLGLSREVEFIADPGIDRDGLSLAINPETKRVFLPKKVNDAF